MVNYIIGLLIVQSRSIELAQSRSKSLQLRNLSLSSSKDTRYKVEHAKSNASKVAQLTRRAQNRAKVVPIKLTQRMQLIYIEKLK